MRTTLICHHDSPLDRRALAGWLASFSTLAGIVVIEEKGARRRTRIVREWQRSGLLGLLDVLAFRMFYRAALAGRDARWTDETVDRLASRYPVPADVPVLVASSPNAPEVVAFLRAREADVCIARCKTLLKRDVYSSARTGTFVMHPGICPEYRNAHGCFWALASDDPGRVGMTLLKIDDGIDTGPVYGWFTYPFDARHESHVVIQARVVLDNLDAIARRLVEIHEGRAGPLDVSGRRSAVWGQPRLTRWIGIRSRAGRAP
jgi:folate-dependent phosphoribosylglycinamide formyltransferase PurN